MEELFEEIMGKNFFFFLITNMSKRLRAPSRMHSRTKPLTTEYHEHHV